MRVCRLIATGLVTAAISVSGQANEIGDDARAFVEGKYSDVLKSEVLLDAIDAQNAKHAGLVQTEIDALDKRWRADDDALIDPILANAVSAYLKKVVERSEGAFSEIFVMDNKGLNVGQSAKTSDYWQGDEAKWIETFTKGAIHIGDVEEDESTQTFQVQVSWPLKRDGEIVGAITFGIDVAALE